MQTPQRTVPDVSPFTDAELTQLRECWPLDPSRLHLNHGSFGAMPTPVANEASQIRNRMAANPMRFFTRYLPAAVTAAVGHVAEFLRGDPDGLAFVVNATAAASTVLASARLQPGDEVVVTDHAYGAVRHAVGRYCADAGAGVIEAEIPLEACPHEANERILAAVTDRTALVVVDHITSPTARLFDVAALGTALRERAVSLAVDAAHAPGTLDIDLRALTEAGVSVWFGNLHKWVCAPPGTAVLYADQSWRDRLRPLVVSWREHEGFPSSALMQGTADMTGWLAAPTAIDFHRRWGYDRVRTHGQRVAAYGARVVAGAFETPDPGGGPLPMRLVPLPPGTDIDVLQRRAAEDLGAEIAVTEHAGQRFIRLSAHLYNQPGDYDALAAALPRLLTM